jgi:hypothetical protein
MKINYRSAPPGSGKTHEISNQACNLAECFNKVLILQPTRDLLGNTAAKEIHPFPCQIFHKGTVEGPVAKALADYVAEVPDDIREVVLATHQVLPHIKNFANKDKWHVLIDEDLQVVRYDKHGEGLDLLGIWRGASFAVIHQTGFGEPSKGAPHGSEITCFAADP